MAGVNPAAQTLPTDLLWGEVGMCLSALLEILVSFCPVPGLPRKPSAPGYCSYLAQKISESPCLTVAHNTELNEMHSLALKGYGKAQEGSGGCRQVKGKH